VSQAMPIATALSRAFFFYISRRGQTIINQHAAVVEAKTAVVDVTVDATVDVAVNGGGGAVAAALFGAQTIKSSSAGE